MQPPDIIECISKDAVERLRINLVGRIGPILGFLRIVVLILPCGLCVIKRRRIARELEFLHHRVRAALFSIHQEGHVNFEFDQLGRLILVAAGDAFIQRLKTVLGFCVVFFLERNLRQIVLRIAKFRIQLGCLFECGLGIIELPLLH